MTASKMNVPSVLKAAWNGLAMHDFLERAHRGMFTETLSHISNTGSVIYQCPCVTLLLKKKVRYTHAFLYKVIS